MPAPRREADAGGVAARACVPEPFPRGAHTVGHQAGRGCALLGCSLERRGIRARLPRRLEPNPVGARVILRRLGPDAAKRAPLMKMMKLDIALINTSALFQRAAVSWMTHHRSSRERGPPRTRRDPTRRRPTGTPTGPCDGPIAPRNVRA